MKVSAIGKVFQTGRRGRDFGISSAKNAFFLTAKPRHDMLHLKVDSTR
jgi:hypothetical protein